MRTEIKFTRTYTVQLDGSGNGKQLITTDSTSDTWRPFHLTTRTGSQAAPNPSCDIYSGKDATGDLIDTTANCSRASTGRIGSVTITQRMPVFVQFTGGNPNDVVTVSLFATKVTP